MQKYISFIYRFLTYGVVIIILLFIIRFCIQIFLLDTFVVNGDSMSPTIESGDKVIVNKTILGARIYRSLDFTDDNYFEPFRIKGIRKIKYDDILVFNHSVSKYPNLRFVIDNVLVKRCIALPGDTIFIDRGEYINNKIGKIHSVKYLSTEKLEKYKSRFPPAYPNNSKLGWNIIDLGPFYIPKQNDTIKLNLTNVLLYKKLIEYETQGKLEEKNDIYFIDGEVFTDYCFKSNYYFVVGDNLANSIDSRFIGPIPEEFIIGIVSKVLHRNNK